MGDGNEPEKQRVWRLHPDVEIKPVDDAPEEVLRKLGGGETEANYYGISRKKARSYPKIVNQDVVDVLRAFGEGGSTYRRVLDRFVEERNIERGRLHPAMEKMVKAFISARYLVAADMENADPPGSVRPSLENGDSWLSYRILENVRCMIDTEIYKVEDGATGAIRALKMSRTDFPREDMRRKINERLENEFALIEKISHENIIDVWEHGTHRGRAYGILDWADGPSVRSYAYSFDEPPTEKMLVGLFKQCLGAVGAVHDAGYLHGDVHTGNFLIKNGAVCLIDFGLTRPAAVAAGDEGAYTEGGVLQYMPPEYARHALEGWTGLWGGVAGEIYSCGVILFALFTRRYPYNWSLYRKDFLRSVLDQPPLTFEECGMAPRPELEAVIRRALAKAPGERFRSAGEFLAALGGVPVVDEPPAELENLGTSE